VRLFQANVPVFALVGILLLLISAGVFLHLRTCTEHNRLMWRATLLHTACGGVFALGMASAWLGRLRLLHRVGRISYGLYLYHLPIYAAFGLAQAGAGISPWRGLAALLTTFVVASLSFRILEAPILSWVRRQGDGRVLGRGRLAISLGSVAALLLAALCVGQTALFFHEHPPIPRKWQYVELRLRDHPDLSGAVYAYRWMGVVHVLDKDGFRRTTPIPGKTPGVPRVATVGNSYTWGACVDADQVLAPVTERLLWDQGVHMEVLNLGKQGGTTEDTLKMIRENVLPLGPDVIVFVATIRNLVPGGESFQQILADPHCANRFRISLRAMQAECRAHGVLFLVLPFHQRPYHQESVAAVKFVQTLCESEGVPLIKVDDYLRKYANRSFEFSRWDQHPTAQCHRLHAEMLSARLLSLWKQGLIPAY
jgi:hypothetical protein